MAYPQKILSTLSFFVAVFLLNGCTQFIEGDQAWPGVSAGTVSAAPDFTAPVGGGQFGQRTPPDVLQNTYGYRGEDLSATAPSQGSNGLYSYDSSQHAVDSSQGLQGAINSQNAQSEMGAGASSASSSSSSSSAASGASDNQDYSDVSDISDPVEDWLATEGASVRTLLTEWGDQAGWRVIWQTDREYRLEAGAMFRGRFMDVASALVRSFARARPSPWATFYKGNRVLLITTQEDENAD